MSFAQRYRFAQIFRGAAFALLQTLRGKRPGRVVYNLTHYLPARELTQPHFAYLLGAVDVPRLTCESYPTACYALRAIGLAVQAQPQKLGGAFHEAAPRLVRMAVCWRRHPDEDFREAANNFLEKTLPLIDAPLPRDVAQALSQSTQCPLPQAQQQNLG